VLVVDQQDDRWNVDGGHQVHDDPDELEHSAAKGSAANGGFEHARHLQQPPATENT
jgi:hypothetical protein